MRRARRWIDALSRRVRMRAVRAADDAGSASIEFIAVGVLMLVPLVYLVLTISAVQAASLAVEGAARQASRVFVQAPDLSSAHEAAERAILVTLADYGVDASDAEVRITCTPNPSDCLTRRGFVTVDIATVVPLPLAPPVFDLDVPLGVTITSTATEQVSRFRADG